jgi:hypothetical protein
VTELQEEKGEKAKASPSVHCIASVNRGPFRQRYYCSKLCWLGDMNQKMTTRVKPFCTFCAHKKRRLQAFFGKGQCFSGKCQAS